MNIPWKALIAVGVCLFGLLAALLTLFAAFNRRDQLVGFNQEIQYDDFAFEVVGARQVNTLGTPGNKVQPQGRFYVVKLKVLNHAKRVSYRFKPKSALMEDGHGRFYRISAAGQKALQESVGQGDCGRDLPAGDTCVTELVYDLPPDSHPAYLRLSLVDPIGALLEKVFFGDKRIRLQ